MVGICHINVGIWITDCPAVWFSANVLVDFSNCVVETMRYAIGLDIAGDTQEAQGVRVNVDVNVFRSDRVGMMI